MTEKMKKRLSDLKARQKAGEPMRCPRCGADLGPAIVGTNPLLALEHFSRHVRPHIVF